jgi:diamine N-acetyltransferase
MPTPPLEITPADESQLINVQDLAHRTWPATFQNILSPDQIEYMLELMYSLPALTQQVREKGIIFILAKEGNDYLGFAAYETNYNRNPATKLHKIYVLPQAQGKGVGKALMDYVIRIALQHHNDVLLLNVNRGNPALRFYQKVGFSIIAEEDIPIGNGYQMEDYIMEKKLR